MKLKLESHFHREGNAILYEEGKRWLRWFVQRRHVFMVESNLPYEKVKKDWEFYSRAIKRLVEEL